MDKISIDMPSLYGDHHVIEVRRLFDDDIVEIDSVFYAPLRK